MRNVRIWTSGLVLAALFVMGMATSARAQFTFTLSPATLTGGRNSTLTFNGTISNNTGADVFVNDIVVTLLNGAPLTPDLNVFFNNVPGIFADGDVYSNSPVFGVEIPNTTPNGTYSGTIQFLGGDDPGATNPLLAQEVSFNVIVTPEAGSFALMGIAGLMAAGIGVRRRK